MSINQRFEYSKEIAEFAVGIIDDCANKVVENKIVFLYEDNENGTFKSLNNPYYRAKSEYCYFEFIGGDHYCSQCMIDTERCEVCMDLMWMPGLKQCAVCKNVILNCQHCGGIIEDDDTPPEGSDGGYYPRSYQIEKAEEWECGGCQMTVCYSCVETSFHQCKQRGCYSRFCSFCFDESANVKVLGCEYAVCCNAVTAQHADCMKALEERENEFGGFAQCQRDGCDAWTCLKCAESGQVCSINSKMCRKFDEKDETH